MLDTFVFTDLNFEQPGRQIGSLKLAHSNDHYSFGIIPIPIAIISNGKGPTILLTAGNHGDEYEGQVVLRRLIQDLKPADVDGRIIILPALNYPAVQAATRVSPLDDVNLNRSFPGHPDASPTQSIAHYIDSVIMPMCDAGMDLHSGGKSAEYIPSTFLSTHPDQALMKKMLGMIDAFSAPYTMVYDGMKMPVSLDVSAQNRHSIPFICTEAGGKGSVNPAVVQMKTQGIYRVLHYLGIINEHPNLTGSSVTTRFMNISDANCFLEAPIHGLFEPYCQLGDVVEASQPAGCIYALDEPERPAVELVFKINGLIIGTRVSSVVERGMFTYSVASEIQRDEVMRFSIRK